VEAFSKKPIFGQDGPKSVINATFFAANYMQERSHL
jgi:hypothetical protein